MDAARKAAVAVIVVPGQELLLVRRAEHPGDPWSGQIGLPGGMKESSDDSLLKTAIRETQEETGIALFPEQNTGRLNDLRPRRKSLPDILIRPFVFRLEERPKTIVSDELQYCFWEPIERLAASKTEIDRREAYAAKNGDIVWGITYWILSDFFSKTGLAPQAKNEAATAPRKGFERA